MAVLSVGVVIPVLAAGVLYVHNGASGSGERHASYARPSAAPPRICSAPSDPGQAARLSSDLQNALHRRYSTVALAVNDRRTGLTCRLGAGWRLDSGSVVKLTVLCALLRKHMEQHQYLSKDDLNLTAAMVTASDGSATSALWHQLGRGWLQHFLSVGGMTRTVLGPGGYWGLTQITAEDEMTLLNLVTTRNHVLDGASRQFALNLLSNVIPSQHWGVPAGAPGGVTIAVADGWMPRRAGDWRVNSIGAFTGPSGGFNVVVLTRDNSSMAYGVATIENAAEVIHRDLNPGAPAEVPRSVIPPSQQAPDEELPPMPEAP